MEWFCYPPREDMEAKLPSGDALREYIHQGMTLKLG